MIKAKEGINQRVFLLEWGNVDVLNHLLKDGWSISQMHPMGGPIAGVVVLLVKFVEAEK